ncbi:TPA: exodeoxyribonuclease VII large subunit, partial [Mannheimia haemolytica]|nr:exodeoxyribonuclease VII large subunit [Mannheimia haemolytica]
YMEYRLEQAIYALVAAKKQVGKELNVRLIHQHPQKQIERQSQMLKQLELKLHWQMEQQLSKKQQKWKNITQRFERNPLPYQLYQQQTMVAKMSQRLAYSIEKIMLKEQRHFQELCTKLDGLSPLKILTRGYSITQTKDGKTLTSTENIERGEAIITQLKTGKIISQVVDFL